MKKAIIFIIVTLILIILACAICIPKPDLSKDEFISLAKKFDQISNVKLEGKYYTNYIKDGISLSIRKDGLCTWSNSKTKECIAYMPDSQTYALQDFNDSELTGLEDLHYTFIRI